MSKLETIKPIVRSRSSSSSSSIDSTDNQSIASSDSGLSLIQTSTTTSQRSIPTSVHLIPAGTSISDVNKNLWIIHQCLKISPDNERFLYLCSQVKRTSTNDDSQHADENNIIQTKISAISHLPEIFKQSRENAIDKARAENDQVDYVFYSAINGQKYEEFSFDYSFEFILDLLLVQERMRFSLR